jgi:hypothetical protein
MCRPAIAFLKPAALTQLDTLVVQKKILCSEISAVACEISMRDLSSCKHRVECGSHCSPQAEHDADWRTFDMAALDQVSVLQINSSPDPLMHPAPQFPTLHRDWSSCALLRWCLEHFCWRVATHSILNYSQANNSIAARTWHRSLRNRFPWNCRGWRFQALRPATDLPASVVSTVTACTVGVYISMGDSIFQVDLDNMPTHLSAVAEGLPVPHTDKSAASGKPSYSLVHIVCTWSWSCQGAGMCVRL